MTILNESHFPDWNISEFRMMRGDTVRSIKHFHFTTWPDFGEYRNQFRANFSSNVEGWKWNQSRLCLSGVPEPPQTLVRFVRAYRERISPDMRPVVVHCSAGVGRSGTFIGLDKILQQVKRFDSKLEGRMDSSYLRSAA